MPTLLEQFLGTKSPEPKADTPMDGAALLESFLKQNKPQELVPSTNLDIINKVDAEAAKNLPQPIETITAEDRAKYDVGGTNRLVRGVFQAPRDAGGFVADLPSNVGRATADAYGSGVETARSGYEDLKKGRFAPRFPTANPETWEGGGVLKSAAGLAGAVFSPITGVVQETVEKPVTSLTGNEKAGEVAGMVAGGVLPVAKAGKTFNASRPTNMAVTKLVEAIGPENLPEVIERLKSNPRLSIIDVSPGVKQDAQKLVTMDGKHQNAMIKAIEGRSDSARGVVESIYDEKMGAPVDVIKKIDDMKAQAKATGSNLINPIVDNVKNVNVTNVVKGIDDAIANEGPVERATLKALKEGREPPLPLSDAQRKLFNIRERIRGDWKDREEMFLDAKGEQGAHELQKSLRREAQDLLDSQNPGDRELGRKLMKVRNSIVDAVDDATRADMTSQEFLRQQGFSSSVINTMKNPDADAALLGWKAGKGEGTYKKALGQYADDMAVQEAFDRGRFILSNRPTKLEDRPESLAKWLKSAKPAEVDAVREGARVAIDNQIRGMRFAAKKGSDIPEVEFNKSKLEMLFGKEEVADLSRKLRDEKDIAQTTTDMLRNSQTAMRLRSNSRIDLPVEKAASLNPFLAPVAEIAGAAMTGYPGASIPVIALQGGQKALFKGRTALARRTNEQLAKMMTAQGPARDELIQILESALPAPKPSIMQITRNAAPRIIGP